MPPIPPPSPPLIQSLHALKVALPTQASHEPSRFQHTLNALTDLTGYIATRTYDSFRRTIEPGAAPGVEEEVKREIRGLKGLVLNRCVFACAVSIAAVTDAVSRLDERLCQPCLVRRHTHLLLHSIRPLSMFLHRMSNPLVCNGSTIEVLQYPMSRARIMPDRGMTTGAYSADDWLANRVLTLLPRL